MTSFASRVLSVEVWKMRLQCDPLIRASAKLRLIYVAMQRDCLLQYLNLNAQWPRNIFAENVQ